MQKTFIGEVIEIGPNEFESNGQLVRNWKIGLQLTDEKGINFYIPQTHELYERAQDISISDRIKVTAHSEIKSDGAIKWKADEIEIV